MKCFITIFDPYFFGWILPELEPRSLEEVIPKEESDGFVNSTLEYQVRGKKTACGGM